MSSTAIALVKSPHACSFVRRWRGAIAGAIIALIAGAPLPAAIAAEPQSPFAMSGTSTPPPPDGTDKAMLAVPLYAAIHDVLPDTYDALRAAVADGYRQRKTDAEIHAILQSQVEPLVAKYLPAASDDAVVELAHVIALELELIGAKGVDDCRSSMFPSPGQPPVDFARYVTPELAARESIADAAVIKSAVTRPHPALSHDDVIEARGMLLEILRGNYSPAEIDSLAHGQTADPALICRIIVGTYKATFALPPEDQAPVLRVLAGAGAQN